MRNHNISSRDAPITDVGVVKAIGPSVKVQRSTVRICRTLTLTERVTDEASTTGPSHETDSDMELCRVEVDFSNDGRTRPNCSFQPQEYCTGRGSLLKKKDSLHKRG